MNRIARICVERPTPIPTRTPTTLSPTHHLHPQFVKFRHGQWVIMTDSPTMPPTTFDQVEARWNAVDQRWEQEWTAGPTAAPTPCPTSRAQRGKPTTGDIFLAAMKQMVATENAQEEQKKIDAVLQSEARLIHKRETAQSLQMAAIRAQMDRIEAGEKNPK